MSHDPDDTSVAESGGHIKGRPISWVVVAFVCGGFLAAGAGVVAALPWLFIAGICVVVVGGFLGWLTHAMAAVTARVETPARQAGIAVPAQAGAAPRAERAEEATAR